MGSQWRELEAYFLFTVSHMLATVTGTKQELGKGEYTVACNTVQRGSDRQNGIRHTNLLNLHGCYSGVMLVLSVSWWVICGFVQQEKGPCVVNAVRVCELAHSPDGWNGAQFKTTCHPHTVGCTVKETNLHSPPHKKQFNTKEDRLEEISGTQQMLPLD